MSGTTAKHGIPYMTAGDQAASIDEASLAMATRLDLLLGESGTVQMTPSAANTDTTVRVNYARSYADLAPIVPVVLVNLAESVASTQTTYVYADGFDATGFTLHIRSSVTTQRTVRWRCAA
jgi:hypothetical protein